MKVIPHRIHIRRFSTSVLRTSPETARFSSPDADFSDTPLPFRKWAGPLQIGKLASHRANIRNKLIDWNVKHEQEKSAQRPETLGPDGRVTELPHAFFLPEPEQPKDAFDENLAHTEEWQDDEDGSGRLEPGDMTLVHSRWSKPQLGVYLGFLGFQELFLLQNGRWLILDDLDKRPRVVVQGFASKEEIADERITKHLPKRPVEREVMPGNFQDVNFIGDVVASASNPMVRRMTSLADEVVVFQRNNIALLDKIYETYSHETEFFTLPFSKLLNWLTGTAPSHAARFAILAVCKRDPCHILLFEPSRGRSIQVIFVPKELKRNCATVVEWTRQYQEAAAKASMGNDVSKMLRQNPVTAFIEKARRIILASRKIRSPTTTGAIGPSRYQRRLPDGSIETQPTGETWSDTDKMILAFMYDTYCRKPVAPNITRHNASASLILRAVGAYPKMDLGRNIGTLFLQELGGMAPWASHVPTYISAPVPGTMGSEELTRLRAASEELAQDLGFELGSSKHAMHDSMQSFRRDLGDLEVYCLDSASASVIDDGISFETCTERPGCSWIHTHIAHPTAFFERDHLFARAARMQMASIYTMSNYHALLPDTVSRTLSLSNGAKALTVSTLLAEDGTVLDIKLCPTKVNNIIRLDKNTVEQLMNPRETEYATLIVGSDPNITPEGAQSTIEDIEKVRKHLHTLNKIDTLLNARRLARQRESGFVFERWMTDAKQATTTTTVEMFDPGRHHRSFHYLGDPTIKITSTRFPLWEKGSKAAIGQGPSVLQGSMVLTGESLGKWCRDRKIPVIYEGLHFHPDFPPSRIQELELYERYRRPRVMPMVQPSYFASANLQQYMKATSPLRRFADMICQWNINAYLQAEGQGEISAGAPINENVNLPWSAEDIQDIIDHDIQIGSSLEKIEKVSSHRFLAYALFRAHHFGEAKLPELWDNQVRTKVPQDPRKAGEQLPGVPEGRTSTGHMGSLHPFKIRTHMMKSEQGWEDDVKANQFMPVKIDSVDPIGHIVYVTAVGPPSDDYTQKEPIRIWSLEGQ